MSDEAKKSKKEEKKKVVEEAEEELSDSDEEIENVGDKSGFLEISVKKDKFKTVFAILHGGSLFYYKDARVWLQSPRCVFFKSLKIAFYY